MNNPNSSQENGIDAQYQRNGKILFTKLSESTTEKKREQKYISKQEEFVITLQLKDDEYSLVEDHDFERPKTFNENTFQQKNKMGEFIRYYEGRAKITIKRPRKEDAQSS